MNFDTFLESAWTDHADRPDQVAERLAGSVGVIEAASQIPAYARIVVHVYGEHLARWAEGSALLASLRASPQWNHSDELAAAVRRGRAVLAHGSGDDAALAGLSRDDRIAVLAAAASVLVAQHQWSRGVAALDEALALATTESGELESASVRGLAIAGNNVASALKEKAERSDDQTAAMLRAADAGLRYWQLAGTWLEEERAQYLVAHTRVDAREFTAALEPARRCIAVCETHDAPAFEQFFGHAVLALAARGSGDEATFATERARALQWHAQVADEEKRWCATELAALG